MLRIHMTDTWWPHCSPNLNSLPFSSLGTLKYPCRTSHFRTSHFPKAQLPSELQTKLSLLTSFQAVVASGEYPTRKMYRACSLRTVGSEVCEEQMDSYGRIRTSRRVQSGYTRAPTPQPVSRRNNTAQKMWELEGLLAINPASVSPVRRGSKGRRSRTVVVLCSETRLVPRYTKPEVRDQALDTNLC